MSQREASEQLHCLFVFPSAEQRQEQIVRQSKYQG